MGSSRQFSCGIGSFGNVSDRFVGGGYKSDKTVKEMIKMAAQVPEMGALEFVHGAHVTRETAPQVKKWMDEAGLKTSIVLPDLWTKAKWGKGSVTSADPQVREDAKAEVRESLEVAKLLDCDLINVWFGQDGWEYSFCQDYIEAWESIAAFMKEIAIEYSDMRIAIEYKIKEPRANMHVGTIGKVLLMIQSTGCDNIGVVLDIGHAFAAYENPSQSIALLKMYGDKLYHTHFNDNYRLWDDDMIAGSIHTIEFIEFLYWMRKTGFKGWYSLDIFPYREDGIDAAQESIEWVNALDNVIDKMGMEKLGELIRKDDAKASLSLLRKNIFG
jgi:xylose isomerase